MGAVHRLYARQSVVSSPRPLRWGSVLATAGGILAAIQSVLVILLQVFIRFPPDAGLRLLLIDATFGILQPFAALLCSMTVLIVWLLAAKKLGSFQKTIVVGGSLACTSIIALFTIVVYQTYYFGFELANKQTPEAADLPYALYVAGFVGGIVGLLLLGFVILKARILGEWSVLPLMLGLLSTPVLYWIILIVFSPFRDQLEEMVAVTATLFELPRILTASGWIILGQLLWSYKE